jgi:hypothetical protein
MEFIEKKITITKRKGYVQIFADTETNALIEEFCKDGVFIFLNYLRKNKKIKFTKRDMEKLYRESLD